MIDRKQNAPTTFLTVATQPQTYHNLTYLLLSFPLGILYFVVTVTGLSLGVGTLPLFGVGLLVLMALFMLLRGVASLERQLATSILKDEITPAQANAPQHTGILRQITAMVVDPYTWRTILFALLKFPLGIASFVLTVVGLAVPLGFISSLVLYRFGPVIIFNNDPRWAIDTFNEALVLASIGVVLLIIALHILNNWAVFCATVTKVCLGAESHKSNTPPSSKRLTMEEAIHVMKSAETIKQPAV